MNKVALGTHTEEKLTMLTNQTYLRHLSRSAIFNLWPTAPEELQTTSKRSMADKSQKPICWQEVWIHSTGRLVLPETGFRTHTSKPWGKPCCRAQAPPSHRRGTGATQCGPALDWHKRKSPYLQNWQLQDKYFDQHPRIMCCFVFPSTSRNIVPTYFHFQATLPR